MINRGLFETVLLDPVKNAANKLFIVSGYATAAMAFHHLQSIRKLQRTVKIELVVGMSASDVISLTNHRAFKQLQETDFSGEFECRYVVKKPPDHSKVYAWYTDSKPFAGFIGSANYTQTAFGRSQRESMGSCNAKDVHNYFKSIYSDTIPCTHPEIEKFVAITDRILYDTRKKSEIEKAVGRENIVTAPKIETLPSVRISLLDRNGTLPQRSGLNWGQRPELRREPNQAYIKLQASIYKSDFFPERGVHFSVFTDDGSVFVCSRAQDNGKAIHTPHNNSIFGAYFRKRIGADSGQILTENDLMDYGRTHVDFYKIDDETFYMDFSV